MAENEKVCLPDDVVPVHYNLWFALAMQDGELGLKKQGEFVGTNYIDIEVRRSTDSITLHAVDLHIVGVFVSTPGKSFPISFIEEKENIMFREEEETVTFRFDEEIPVGPATLCMTFKGVLGNAIKGFYRREYELDGEKRCVVMTGFGATNTRRIFPSWDEPLRKATFSVIFTVGQEYTVFSIFPFSISDLCSTAKAVIFKATPKMPTYLFNFAVYRSSDFEYLKSELWFKNWKENLCLGPGAIF